MIETILNILSICALTSVSPYYDCSNTWEIHLIEDDYACRTSYGCVSYNQDFILGHHIITISAQHLDYKLPNGDSLLWHELKHAICECDNDIWSKYST